MTIGIVIRITCSRITRYIVVVRCVLGERKDSRRGRRAGAWGSGYRNECTLRIPKRTPPPKGSECSHNVCVTASSPLVEWGAPRARSCRTGYGRPPTL